MHADIQPLFRSPIVKILDFKCKAHPGSVSQPEYIDTCEISFTRTGYFGLRAGKQSWDVDNQIIMLGSAGSEFVFTHGHHVSDECTVFQIPKTLLEQARQTFWQKRATTFIHQRRGIRLLFPTPILYSTPSLDYLHRRLLAATRHNHRAGTQLEIETLLVRLIAAVYQGLYDEHHVLPARDMRLIGRHHETVERAKDFMMTHFQQELSLSQIARHAYTSEFHFCRLFKSLTSYSPYRYLIEIRLHHAALLLQNTSDSVTEVCFASGFHPHSHFTATFTNFFGMSPSAFRHR